ncbi:MAG: hypothetical protein LBJ75_01545 [Puniceicoccales bacterium]|jgi:hypothetical protein|nr:hypothetical protein [Puniceicoccales bacterium]
MKKEYEEKLAIARKLITENDLSCREEEERVLEGFRIIETLILTLDTEILCELLDFFITETKNEYKVCETLESLIFDHFPGEQILEAYYQKFDSLAEKNPERCTFIAIAYFFSQESNYEKFRKMFNTVKSKHSVKILEELKRKLKYGEWIDKENDRAMVYALEEDMGKW